MAQPYVGEIRIFAGNFAISGWYFCDGTLYPISGDDVLFNLIGTTYGGDGLNTFAVPDLRGRVPRHFGTLSGTTYVMGQVAGVETVTVNTQQLPQHQHTLLATAANQTLVPSSTTVLAQPTSAQPGVSTFIPYGTGTQTTLAPGSISQSGGSQPHENLQPYIAVNFLISRFGIFPSQT